MIKKRSWIYAVLIAGLLTIQWPGSAEMRSDQPIQSVQASVAEPVATHAKAAALIDVESGRILYSSNGDTQMKIASLTKIMTAIVAIESGNLSDKVTVGPQAAGKEGSSLYLKAGEEMSLQNLLYGLMLRSGNDAATAIAEHVGGSEEGFVFLMNEKAEWLGLENTHFMNPHGLDNKDHYSSANDLAKLTAYALHNNVFKEIVKTRVMTVPNPNEAWDYKWTNKNKMLAMYEGADGVKTGYTKQAFRCLVSSATRGGQQLAAVTINDGDDWADHRKLLDWGFSNYPLNDVVHQGQMIAGQSVEAGATLRYPLADAEKALLTSKLILNPSLSREEAKASEAGRLEYYLQGNLIGRVPVYEKTTAKQQPPVYGKAKGAFTQNEAGTDYSAHSGVTWRHSFDRVFRVLFGGGR